MNKKDVNLFKKVGWDIVLLLVDSWGFMEAHLDFSFLFNGL